MNIDTEILCGFIDGELDAATTAEVQAALDVDEDLRQEYEGLRKTVDLVRGLRKVSAPAEILQGITANAEREQLLGDATPAPPRRAGLYWGLSIAASLLIGVGLGVLGYHELRHEPEPDGGHIPVVLVDHDTDETLTREKMDLPTASVSKTGLDATMVQGKGGGRIARSGPEPVPAGKSAGTTTEKSTLAEQYQREPQYADKNAPADEAEIRLVVQASQPIPLEPQVRANNFVNRNMAVNLDFKAEPLNVEVVSNDTTRTLQYVQQWAASNSLVDLNKASPEVNFPVYTQVVYQGKPGTNIAPADQNGILLRTTRSQARQIVSELQNQKPLVVSVSVKDKKNTLGFAGEQIEEEKPGLADGRESGPVQTPGTTAQPEADDHYLFQITNQRQVQSLEDLVTLVVMVTDTRSPQVTTPAAGSKTNESE